MKVKSRSELEQKASFIFQDLEQNFRPCETLYILSELAKTLSLVMLQKEQEET
jgi:hypothetical protein